MKQEVRGPLLKPIASRDHTENFASGAEQSTPCHSHRARIGHDHHEVVLFKVTQRDARENVSLHDWPPRLDWLAPIEISSSTEVGRSSTNATSSRPTFFFDDHRLLAIVRALAELEFGSRS